MYTFIMTCGSLICNFMLILLLSQLLPRRFNLVITYAYSLVWTVFAFIKLQFEYTSMPFQIVGFISFIPFISIGVVAFKGKSIRKLVVFTYFSILMMMSDALGFAITANHFGNTGWMSEQDVFHALMYSASVNIIYILIGSVSVLVWRMVAARKFQPFYLLFIALPVSQYVMIYSYLFSAQIAYFFIGVVMCVAADMVLLVYTISQEKKTELEEELRETRYMMELEQSHYREIEKHREELLKIRHDFNNQLASIGQLFHTGDENSAREMISALAGDIEQTKENPYCVIPVVNAVLVEKLRECESEGIAFEPELYLPPELSVEKLHLCSIFSNLLDNAISACKQEKVDKPVVRLTSLTDGDYLFIKVINPSGKPAKTPTPGRGYGSRILSDLAARYGGDYRTEYRDGVFTAVVSLLAVTDK